MSGPDDTETREMTGRDRLAAEHALGLLEGEELLEARGLAASDADFARAVSDWEERLAPLLGSIAPVEPGPHVWDRIEGALQEDVSSNEDGEVIALQRQVRRWRWVSGGMAAAAVVALALLAGPLVGPTVQPTPTAPTLASNDAPLVASIPIADTPLRIGVTWLPDREELLVSASELTADGVHDHELWLVAEDGSAPRSLGVVVPGEERRVSVDAALAERIGDGSDLILTREPIGGAPEGAEAGPTVASGEFSAV